MIKGIINSFVFAWCGLKTVWREERNFRIEFFISLIVLLTAIFYEFDFAELGFVVFSILIILSFEIVNTAIEDLCNKVESNTDPVIKKVKDMMSGFVLLGTIGGVFIWVLVFWNHFLN